MPVPGDWPAPITIAILSLRRMTTLCLRFATLGGSLSRKFDRAKRASPSDHSPAAVNDKARSEEPSVNRRAFAALLPAASPPLEPFGSNPCKERPSIYASVGPELALYEIDFVEAALQKRAHRIRCPPMSSTPGCIPRSSTSTWCRATAVPGVPSDKNFANAFTVDPRNRRADRRTASRQSLPSRPIHTSVDRARRVSADRLTTSRATSPCTALKADGTIGESGAPAARSCDDGIYAHQILTTPSNQTAILVTRGNNAARRQAGGSRRAQALRLQARRVQRHGLGQGRHRPRLRAAASRFPSDQAVGLCLDGAAEQDRRLSVSARRRAGPRLRSS